MVNKPTTGASTEQVQYQTIERTLERAGYQYEAYIEDRPRISNGSLVFSTFRDVAGKASNNQSNMFTNNNNNTDSSGSSSNTTPFCPGMTASRTFPGTGFNPGRSTVARSGYGLGGAASMFGASISSGLHHLMSSNMSINSYTPTSHFGSGYPLQGSGQSKRYSQTVRSSASSILSLNRASKQDPPVAIMPHYNSPYESIFYGQPGVQNFVGKDVRIGTICISTRADQGTMHVLIRTVFKFVHQEIPDRDRLTQQFTEIRAYYPKKDDFQPMLHLALKRCLESVPENEVNRRQASSSNAADIVVSEPGWVKSPQFILSLVKNLQEVKGEAFSEVLKNLEAQMKPSTLMVDFVIPDPSEPNPIEEPSSPSSLSPAGVEEQDQFWNFFKGLGDPVENEMFRPTTAKTSTKSETINAGSEPEEYLQDAIDELISTERTYNQQLRVLVNTFLKEARAGGRDQQTPKDAPFPLSKYEIRAIFFNVEQLLELSTTFLSELSAYEEWAEQQRTCNDRQDTDLPAATEMNLGDICHRNLAVMGCFKSYLINREKAIGLNLKASRRPGFDDYQEWCMHQGSTSKTLMTLLSEPFQRISRYPMVFKSIIMRSKPGSTHVSGLQAAATLASEMSHMEESFVDKTGFMLRHLTDTVAKSPRAVFCSSRIILGYLDGYETNLLTGEKGRAVCLILFSDKIMIVRRPPVVSSPLGSSSGAKYLSGEVLFPAEFDEKGHPKEPSTFGAGRGATGAGHARRSSYPGIMKGSGWKFMGWRDISSVKIVSMEQTDPEGLFCMTSTHHQIPQRAKGNNISAIDDTWEGTHGIMPDNLDHRDQFISKFNSALAIVKAKTVGNSEEWTARLHVAELEVVCNVFTETQYRDFKEQKGDVAMFYAPPGSPPGPSSTHPRGMPKDATQTHQYHPQPQIVDLMSFKRLPQFVGLIQSSTVTSSTIATSPTLSSSGLVSGSGMDDSGGSLPADENRQHGFRVVLKGKSSLSGSGTTEAITADANRFLDVDAFQILVTDLVANLHWTMYSLDPYQSAQLHFSRLYMDGADQYLLSTVVSSFSRTKSIRARGSGATHMHHDTLQASSPTQFRTQSHGGGATSPAESPTVAGAVSSRSPSGGMVGRPLYNTQRISTSPMSPLSAPARGFSIPLTSPLGQPPSLPNSLCNSQHPPLGQGSGISRNKMKTSMSVMSLLLPGRKKTSVGLSSMVFTGECVDAGGMNKTRK